MKYITFMLVMFGLFSSQAHSVTINDNPPHANELMSNYALEAGDTIRVLVYRETDLTLETELTDAGTIIFPFLGEISVAGRTVGELAQKITDGLSGRYLVDPKVSVQVIKYRQFFVNGEVKQPGAFPFVPGLNIQKAISMAGGFSERASQSSAKLIREKDTAHKEVEVSLDAHVAPGDIVIIEESFF